MAAAAALAGAAAAGLIGEGWAGGPLAQPGDAVASFTTGGPSPNYLL